MTMADLASKAVSHCLFFSFFLFFYALSQCFGSVSISIRIRIQHFRSIRIRIQVFLWPKWKKKCFQNFFIFIFKALIALKHLLRTSSKMVNVLFNLKSRNCFPFWTTFWLAWIRIRILITDPDSEEPFQYGSTWIRIRNRNTVLSFCKRPDPDIEFFRKCQSFKDRLLAKTAGLNLSLFTQAAFYLFTS